MCKEYAKVQLMVFLILIASTTAFSAPTWVPVDGSTLPTPPTVNLIRSDADETVLQVKIHGFWSEDIVEDGETYQSLTFPDYATTQEIGKPAMPSVVTFVGIPFGSDVSVSVSGGSDVVLSGYKAFPYQRPLYDGQIRTEFDINSDTYGQDAMYPELRAETTAPGIWRDVRMVNVNVYPICFNPVTGELQVTTDMTVRLEFTAGGDKNAALPSGHPVLPRYDEMYRKSIINYDYLDLESAAVADKGADVAYDYLIIAHDPWVDNVQALANWKNSQGMSTQIVALSTIGADTLAIKNYITQEYTTNGIQYVLLVGDPDDLPGYEGYTYAYGSIYCDYYYALLSGADYYPEVAVGRFSAKTETEISNMVNKSVNFESNPPEGAWLDNSLLIAHQELAPGKYQGCKEEIRLATYSHPLNFTTAYGASFALGGDEASNADVNAAINAGNRYVNYRGHGGTAIWGSSWNVYSESYDTLCADALVNGQMTPIVFSIACTTGQIQWSGRCLGEGFTRGSQAAAAFLGATRPSWTIPNHYYDKQIYQVIFEEGVNNIGEATNIVSVRTIGVYGSLGIDNAMMYLWLGDPSLDAFSEPYVPTTRTIWVDGTYGDDVTGDGTAGSPYQTIGQGISQAATGDTVQVRPGTYIENIDFAGKGIVVNGFYGPEMTILKPAVPNTSTITMVSGEPSGTQFSGFTVRDGGDCYPFLIDNGSEPLVTDNIFTYNIRNVPGYNKAVIKTASSAPVFTHNLFYDNSGISCIGIWSGTATITNNTFDNNARGFLTISALGGIATNNIVTNSWQYGIHGNFTVLDYNDVWNNNPDYNLNNPGPNDISADPLYIDAPVGRYYVEYNSPCIDAGDPSQYDPDMTVSDIGAFHAVYVPYQSTTIQYALTVLSNGAVDILVYPGTYTENIDFLGQDCRLMSVEGPESTILQPAAPNTPTIKMVAGENEKTLLSGFKIINGGDNYTFMIDGGALPLIRDNVFWFNIRGVPGQNKSVVRTDHSTPFFFRNLFYENAGISCIAIYTGSGEIVNNTFEDNSRGFLTLTGQGIAKNNIVTNSWEYGIHGSFTELDYNDVWGNNPDYNLNNPGPHDISADPLYLSNYGLQDGSPCVDAGDPAIRYNDPDYTRNDMGYLPRVSYFVEVPGDYPTIQAAINGVPSDGATIYVHPGVYDENIDFIGKTIRLIGAGNTASGDTTFLEPYVEDNPTVVITNGEGVGTELSGFTIRNGGDTYTVTIGGNASPLIADNIFYDNIICPTFPEIPDRDDLLLKEIVGGSGTEIEPIVAGADGLPDGPPPPPSSNCGNNKVVIKCMAPSGVPVIRGNLFYDNGGISCVGVWTSAYAEIINNTIDGNPRGILTISSNGGVAINNIITNSDEYGVYGAWTRLAYNDVWNNNPDYLSANPGLGSISADPRYVNPSSADYTLMGLSPCIDAGDPDPIYNDPDDSRNDMGAFWYDGLPAAAKETSAVPAVFSLSQNFPNPFNPSTRIEYSLAQPCHVEISVFNILGQNIRSLIDGDMDAGSHSVEWYGKDSNGNTVASGIYFYRIKTDAFVESKKMLLLK